MDINERWICCVNKVVGDVIERGLNKSTGELIETVKEWSGIEGEWQYAGGVGQLNDV